VRYIPIGKAGGNLAVSALALRPAQATFSGQAFAGAELFARVTNYGPEHSAAVLSFYRDDELISARRVAVGAGQSASVLLPGLPPAPAVYRAALSGHEAADQLPLDDTAFAVFQPPVGGTTLLVSEGNLFLEQLLAALPNLAPYRAVPDEQGALTLPTEPFDLYVLDGVIPDPLPPGNLLILNPPPNPLFPVTGVIEHPGDAVVAEGPLTRFVEWSAINILQARAVETPVWGRLLVNTAATPLVFAGETAGRRVAVVTFDLHDSDLPLQVTFPILFANLINYLAPPLAFDTADGLQPGEGLTILPDLSVTQVVVAAPGDRVFTPPITEDGIRFTATETLGVYAVNYLSPDGHWAEFFAVNLFAPEESDIAPQSNIRIGQATVEHAGADAVGQVEYWPWLAGLAFVVLLVEWWAYHRRN